MHICGWCGKVFGGYRYRTVVFCSRSCSAKNARKKSPKKRKGIITHCLECQKEVYVETCKIGKRKFCSKTCQYTFLRTKNAWGFKKGKVPMPNNPYRRIFIDGKYRRVHRILVEKHLGRKLSRNEHVHHINGNPLDNRIENLEVLTPSEHLRLHKAKSG